MLQNARIDLPTYLVCGGRGWGGNRGPTGLDVAVTVKLERSRAGAEFRGAATLRTGETGLYRGGQWGRLHGAPRCLGIPQGHRRAGRWRVRGVVRRGLSHRSRV